MLANTADPLAETVTFWERQYYNPDLPQAEQGSAAFQLFKFHTFTAIPHTKEGTTHLEEALTWLNRASSKGYEYAIASSLFYPHESVILINLARLPLYTTYFQNLIRDFEDKAIKQEARIWLYKLIKSKLCEDSNLLTAKFTAHTLRDYAILASNTDHPLSPLITADAYRFLTDQSQHGYLQPQHIAICMENLAPLQEEGDPEKLLSLLRELEFFNLSAHLLYFSEAPSTSRQVFNKSIFTGNKLLSFALQHHSIPMLELFLSRANQPGRYKNEKETIEQARLGLAHAFLKDDKADLANQCFSDCLQLGYTPTLDECNQFELSVPDIIATLSKEISNEIKLALIKRLKVDKTKHLGIQKLKQLQAELANQPDSTTKNTLLAKITYLQATIHLKNKEKPEAITLFYQSITYGHLPTITECHRFSLGRYEIASLAISKLSGECRNILAEYALASHSPILARECLCTPKLLLEYAQKNSRYSTYFFIAAIKKGLQKLSLEECSTFKPTTEDLQTLYKSIDSLSTDVCYILGCYAELSLENEDLGYRFKFAAIRTTDTDVTANNPPEEVLEKLVANFNDSSSAFKLFLITFFTTDKMSDALRYLHIATTARNQPTYIQPPKLGFRVMGKSYNPSTIYIFRETFKQPATTLGSIIGFRNDCLIGSIKNNRSSDKKISIAADQYCTLFQNPPSHLKSMMNIIIQGALRFIATVPLSADDAKNILKNIPIEEWDENKRKEWFLQQITTTDLPLSSTACSLFNLTEDDFAYLQEEELNISAKNLYALYQYASNVLQKRDLAASLRISALKKHEPKLRESNDPYQTQFLIWKTAAEFFQEPEAYYQLFVHYLMANDRHKCLCMLDKAITARHREAFEVNRIVPLGNSVDLNIIRSNLLRHRPEFSDQIIADNESNKLSAIGKILYFRLSLSDTDKNSDELVLMCASAYRCLLQDQAYLPHQTTIIKSAQSLILYLLTKGKLTNEIKNLFQQAQENIEAVSFFFSFADGVIQGEVTDCSVENCAAHKTQPDDLLKIIDNSEKISADRLYCLGRYADTLPDNLEQALQLKSMAIQKKRGQIVTPSTRLNTETLYRERFQYFNDSKAAYHLFEHYACLSDFAPALLWLGKAGQHNASRTKTIEQLKLKSNENVLEFALDEWTEKKETFFWDYKAPVPCVFLYQYIQANSPNHIHLKNSAFINAVAHSYARLIKDPQYFSYRTDLITDCINFFLETSAEKSLSADGGLYEIFMDKDWYPLALRAAVLSQQRDKAETIVKSKFKLPYSDKMTTLLLGALSNKPKDRTTLIELSKKRKHPYLALFFMMSPNHQHPKHAAKFFGKEMFDTPKNEEITAIKNFLSTMGIELTEEDAPTFLKSLYNHLPDALFSANTEKMVTLANLFKEHGNVYAHLYWIACAAEAGHEEAEAELLKIVEDFSPKEHQSEKHQQHPKKLIDQLNNSFDRLIFAAHYEKNTEDSDKYIGKAFLVLILIRRVFGEKRWFKNIPEITGDLGIFPYTIGMNINNQVDAFTRYLDKHLFKDEKNSENKTVGPQQDFHEDDRHISSQLPAFSNL